MKDESDSTSRWPGIHPCPGFPLHCFLSKACSERITEKPKSLSESAGHFGYWNESVFACCALRTVQNVSIPWALRCARLIRWSPHSLWVRGLQGWCDLPTYTWLVNGRASNSNTHLTHGMSQATLKPQVYGSQEVGTLLSSSIPLSTGGRRQVRRIKPPAVITLGGACADSPLGREEGTCYLSPHRNTGDEGAPYSYQVRGKVLVPYSVFSGTTPVEESGVS